ncbi:hypothetical protein Tco_1235064 [Tanacetum coccineum]
MRKQLKSICIRPAMSGPCQCGPKLSFGLPIYLVGPGAQCNNTAQTQRPEMDLFAFIRHSDPTKVRVGERTADTELKIAEVDINGDNAGQEHSAEKDDDVQEEVFAKDALEVVTEKPQKKRKRKVVGDASGSTLPPKKLRDDHKSLPPSTSGKSLSTLRGMVLEGSVIPSDVARPFVTAFVTLMLDVEPVDSISAAEASVVTFVITTTADANVACWEL